MINLNFKYISAKNFLCFGQDGVELNVENFNNVVLIKGFNYDRVDEDNKSSSNGTGKSTIPEIIVYTLYGKTIKENLSHDDVINNKIGKGLRTEVVFDEYRVVRTRKPNSLRVWKSSNGNWDESTEITLGGMPATQELIENIIGLSYNAFKNIVVFTDSNKDCFLECDAPTKRKIVENLLSLSVYKSYSDATKSILSGCKEKLKSYSLEYNFLTSSLDDNRKKINLTKEKELLWIKDKTKQINDIESQILLKKKELKETDNGNKMNEYNEAVEMINTLMEKNNSLSSEIAKVNTNLKQIKSKYDEYSLTSDEIKNKLFSLNNSKSKILALIESHQNKIKELKGKKEDADCPVCYGKIKHENFQHVLEYSLHEIDKNNKEIESINKTIDEINGYSKQIKELILSTTARINEHNEKINEINKEISSNNISIKKLQNIKKPEDGSVKEKILLSEIEQLCDRKSSIEKEINGRSPYKDILISLENDIETSNKALSKKRSDISEIEGEISYISFWIDAFGDYGIRKYILDNIIPALNNNIAYWLQFLIDGKIKVSFDNELSERIEKNPSDGSLFAYYALSGGERRRVNLAISQAFAYVMSIVSGSSPSVVFLDEVATNIDSIGVVGVYNMIMEISKSKKVFITTHDKDLQQLLDGCQVLKLERRNDFTKVV